MSRPTPKHTPWRVVEGANNDPEWPDLRIVCNGSDLFLAEDAGHEEAHLAAAAPDLLEAVQEAVKVLEKPYPYGAERQYAYSQCMAALARARGETKETT